MDKKYSLLFFILLFSINLIKSQNSESKLIQFSGVVVTEDSLKPVPYMNIIIKGSYRGTVSDYFGFFSFVAKEKDTIEFSSIGYKKAYYVIPDSLQDVRYSLIQMMKKDTVFLKETVIYPWPTIEQFKEAFTKLRIPDDDLERAKKNLARAEMKERYENMPMDGSMNQKYAMQQETNKLYYAGQLPPNNLLNPLAWAQFIKAWKDGEFKKKDE